MDDWICHTLGGDDVHVQVCTSALRVATHAKQKASIYPCRQFKKSRQAQDEALLSIGYPRVVAERLGRKRLE